VCASPDSTVHRFHGQLRSVPRTLAVFPEHSRMPSGILDRGLPGEPSVKFFLAVLGAHMQIPGHGSTRGPSPELHERLYSLLKGQSNSKTFCHKCRNICSHNGVLAVLRLPRCHMECAQVGRPSSSRTRTHKEKFLQPFMSCTQVIV
jgi:hypothetical protein